MNINDKEWQWLLNSLISSVDIDFNTVKWNLNDLMMQNDQFTQSSQIINLINHTDTLEFIMLIKACQDFTPSDFTSDSVSVVNMLSDFDLHKQQTLSDKVNENSDVNRLILWIYNLEVKWVLMKGAIIILETNVSLLFRIIEILR